MVGNLVRKFENKLKRSYIEEIVNKFNKVRSILFYKGDIEQIVGSYLHYDKLIMEFNTNIAITIKIIVSICITPSCLNHL